MQSRSDDDEGTGRGAARSTGPLWHAAGALIDQCVSSLGDMLLVTEAEPLDEPGPRIVFVNGAFERQTGYAPAEVVGRSPRFLQGPGTDRAELHRIRCAVGRLEPVRAELVNYTKRGEPFVVEMDVLPVFDAGGRCTHWVSVQRDATRRKRAEAERLARAAACDRARDALSAGTARDFDRIVAGILGNAAIGRQDIAASGKPHASPEPVNLAALRACSLLRNIVAHGGTRVADREVGRGW